MGVLTNIFLSRIKLPRDIHRYAFRKYPERTALQFTDSAMTYGQLQDRSYRLALAWQAYGLQKGDTRFLRRSIAGRSFSRSGRQHWKPVWS